MNSISMLVLTIVIGIFNATESLKEQLLFKRIHGILAIPVISEGNLFEEEITVVITFDLPQMYQFVNFTCKPGDTECEFKKEFNNLNTGITNLYQHNLETRRKKRQLLMPGALTVGKFKSKTFKITDVRCNELIKI